MINIQDSITNANKLSDSNFEPIHSVHSVNGMFMQAQSDPMDFSTYEAGFLLNICLTDGTWLRFILDDNIARKVADHIKKKSKGFTVVREKKL